MTKSICRHVLIEMVEHRGQSYDKGLLMTDLGAQLMRVCVCVCGGGSGNMLNCCVTVPFCQL